MIRISRLTLFIIAASIVQGSQAQSSAAQRGNAEHAGDTPRPTGSLRPPLVGARFGVVPNGFATQRVPFYPADAEGGTRASETTSFVVTDIPAASLSRHPMRRRARITFDSGTEAELKMNPVYRDTREKKDLFDNLYMPNDGDRYQRIEYILAASPDELARFEVRARASAAAAAAARKKRGGVRLGMTAS